MSGIIFDAKDDEDIRKELGKLLDVIRDRQQNIIFVCSKNRKGGFE